MFPCPSCGNTLAAHATQCQFCGADVSRVPRQAGGPQVVTGHGVDRKWILTAYYLVGTFWLLLAVYGLLNVLLIAPAVRNERLVFDAITIAVTAYLCLRVVIAIGFLARVEIVRAIVNILAFLGLAIALLMLVGHILSALIVGAYAILFIIGDLIEIGINGGIIWLIGETDDMSKW